MRREVHTVIVAYHGAEALDRCLAELGRTDRVTVVDNSSSTDVRDVTSRHGAEYVDAGANIGFAAGVNLALRRLLAEHAARRAAAQPRRPPLAGRPRPSGAVPARAGAYACRVRRSAARRRQRTRAARDAGPSRRRSGCGWRRSAPGAFLERADFVIGAVLLLRWEALQQVGELDERFFLYGEETDWQRRAAQLGWSAALCLRRGRRARRRRLERRPAPPRSALPRRPGDLHTEVARPSRLVGLPSRCMRRSDRESRDAQRRSQGRGRAPRSPLRARPETLPPAWPGASRCLASSTSSRRRTSPGVERYVTRSRARDGRPRLGRRGRRRTPRRVCRRRSATQRCGSRARLRSRRCARCVVSAGATSATRT